MLGALVRAVLQLFDPRLAGLVLLSLALSGLSFVAVWLLVGWALLQTQVVSIGWIDTALDALGGIATLAVTWFLFPVIASAFVALWLDRVAARVEAVHYPELGKAKGAPLLASLGASLRLLGLGLLLNLLLLPLWFVPPVYAVAWWVANGTLIGREFADLVALRRHPAAEARQLQRAHRFELLLLGVLFAFLATVPVVNLVAPLVLTAALVHRRVAWTAARPGSPA